MTHARRGNIAAAITFVAIFAIGLAFSVNDALAQSQSAAFTGSWCAQGDPTKQTSINDNGSFLTLTNENGDTSTGQYQGQNSIVAPGWQFVTGTLSPDGSQINWSNGTLWTRCNTGGGHQRLNLTGTWYAQGSRSQSCTIRQRGNNLELSNESGDHASGEITGKRQLTTNWSGTPIAGTVTLKGDRINWDNGTFWTRSRVYSAPN